MTTSGDLRSRYREIIESLDPMSTACDGEIVETLLQNEWLRILVVVCTDSEDIPAAPNIMVELSLPRTPAGSERRVRGQAGGNTAPSSESLLAGMIEHLEYLLRLKAAGFDIHVIKEDCLWTATRPAREPPSDDVFRVLVPPR